MTTRSGFGIQGSGLGNNVAQSFRCAAFRGANNRRSRRRVYATQLRVGLIAVALALAQACSPKPGVRPAGLFPESNEVPGWIRSGETRTFEASRLWEYIDGDAERYLQAGVQKTLTTDFRYKDQTDAVADIHVMANPEGARKIFESAPSVGSQPIVLGDAARLSKGSLTFRKGPYFVRLVAYQEAPEMGNALVELGKAIEKKLH
jgi:hypothetical protein